MLIKKNKGPFVVNAIPVSNCYPETDVAFLKPIDDQTIETYRFIWVTDVVFIGDNNDRMKQNCMDFHKLGLLVNEVGVEVLTVRLFLELTAHVHGAMSGLVNLPNLIMKPTVVGLVELSMLQNPRLKLFFCHPESQKNYFCVFLFISISLNILCANFFTR